MARTEDRIETPAGEFHVTVAQPGDAVDVLRLRDDVAVWMVERGIEQWRPSEYPLELVEAPVAAGLVHVVRVGGALIASVMVLWDDPFVWGDAADSTDPAGYIHLLMVDRAHAHCQLGRSLLSWAEGHMRRCGRQLARLDCVSSNRALRSYYEDAGYRHVGYQQFPDIAWALEVALYEKSLEP